MGRTLAHEIRQEVDMIFSQLLNLRLFCGIILRSDDLIHPPFITGSGTQHATHEMVMSVCVGKGMQGIVLIYSEMIGGNKDCSTGTQGNITHIVSYSSGTYSGGRIIPGSRRYHNICGNPQFVCHLRQYAAHLFITLITSGQLLFSHSADLTHFLRPATVLHIKQ